MLLYNYILIYINLIIMFLLESFITTYSHSILSGTSYFSESNIAVGDFSWQVDTPPREILLIENL